MKIGIEILRMAAGLLNDPIDGRSSLREGVTIAPIGVASPIITESSIVESAIYLVIPIRLTDDTPLMIQHREL